MSSSGFMKSFVRGLHVPVGGLQLMTTNARVRRKAILPFIFTFLVFIVGIVLGIPTLAKVIPWMTASALSSVGLSSGTIVYSLVYWPAVFFAWPAAVFALFYVLFVLARLVATPFYSLLAETVLVERGLMKPESFRLGFWLKSSSHLMTVSLAKLVIFLVVGAVLFVASFLPGLGLLAAFGFLLLASFDIVDLSMEALRYGIRERLRFFWRELPAFMGLAVAMGLVFLVPGLNFLLFPAAIAGASEMIRLHRHDRDLNHSAPS